MENRQIRRLGIFLLGLFLALFVNLNYLQVVHADKLNNDPRNTRSVVRDFSQPRGKIISADGTVLAQSDPSNDSFEHLRTYPTATAQLFAEVTGYFSFTFGSDGVERSYNDELTGRSAPLKLSGLSDLLLDRRRTANVTLTLPVSVQTAAAQALGNRPGAVVALDPRNGNVLALWSTPSYDPNPLASHDQKTVGAARQALLADPGKPLSVKAYHERYFPGSTFKVVTSAAALTSGTITPTTPSYPVLTQLIPPQTDKPLRNFAGESCGGDLAHALQVSCNTTFAQVGLDLGGDKLAATAGAFGFNELPPLDIPGVAASFFPAPSVFAHDKPALAQSAIGQRDVAASPLQMALVAAGVANGGVIMKPHVMAEIRDDEGNVVERWKPAPWRTAISPDVAAQLRDMMVGVVNGGTATVLSDVAAGVQVAAKTGTAQLGTTPPSSHAWMIAFAPADAPRVAVAVLVEGQPGVSEITGGRVAGPIAKSVLQAALAAVPQ